MNVRLLAPALVVTALIAGGTVAAASPTVGAVSAATMTRQWSAPRLLWSGPTGSVRTTDLQQVVDSRGGVTLAWTVVTKGSSRVMAARLGPKGWSKPRTVIDVAGVGTYATVSMAAGPQDEVVIATAAEGSDGVHVSAVRFASGGWSPAWTLGDYPAANSRVRHVYGLSTIADSIGVSVLWQVQPNDSHATTFVARGLPSAAREWTAPTVLDDQATGSFSVVRDGAATIRTAWQHGPDVVSVQGSTTSWGPREILGPSGDVRDSPHAYLATKAAADTSGTVLVTWVQPDYGDVDFACPATLAALHTSAGWAPAAALPVMDSSFLCLASLDPFVGQGMPPTVVGFDAERWAEYSSATVWSGTAWGAVQRTQGQAYATGPTLLALDTRHDYSKPAPGADADHQWLTSSTLSPTGWSEPVRATDPAGGWVGGYAGTTTSDGSYVVVYGKRRPWRSVAVWSVTYASGAWSKARIVAPPMKARQRSSGAWLAVPVAAPDGTVTASWVLDDKVFASTSR